MDPQENTSLFTCSLFHTMKQTPTTRWRKKTCCYWCKYVLHWQKASHHEINQMASPQNQRMSHLGRGWVECLGCYLGVFFLIPLPPNFFSFFGKWGHQSLPTGLLIGWPFWWGLGVVPYSWKSNFCEIYSFSANCVFQVFACLGLLLFLSCVSFCFVLFVFFFLCFVVSFFCWFGPLFFKA